MAQELAKAGAAVAVLARSEDQLTETVALIEGAGGCAIALPAAYAVHATGNWAEDFGAAQLANGLATVMMHAMRALTDSELRSLGG
jgi:NAD(P)-dependent dehydrogenase (short-subunit alcohol dehydrogenase family)